MIAPRRALAHGKAAPVAAGAPPEWVERFPAEGEACPCGRDAVVVFEWIGDDDITATPWCGVDS